MAYKFLRKDYEALQAKIEELESGVREAGKEQGLWATQGAETYHDNFGYEEGQRQQWALRARLEDYLELRDNAEIVEARTPDVVDVGAEITVEDQETQERRKLRIGSYHLLGPEEDGEVSYAAPLAKPLLGATVGEEREVRLRDREVTYRVVSIE